MSAIVDHDHVATGCRLAGVEVIYAGWIAGYCLTISCVWSRLQSGVCIYACSSCIMLVSLCHVAAATFQRPLQLKLLQPPTSSPTNTYQGSSQAGPVCQLTPPMLHRASLLLAVLLLSISTSTILSVAAFPIESSQPVITPVEKLALKARQDNVVPATSIIPDFALQYAPVMYLHSDEQW